MPEQPFKPGFGTYSASPSSQMELYDIENMDRDPDGFWRPRWGLKFLHDFAGDITHISPHPTTQAVMLIYNSGTLAYWKTDDTTADLDTGWPTSFVKACSAPAGAADVWAAHKAGVNSTAGALTIVNSSYVDSTVAAAPNGNWVETHNRILFSINNLAKTIAWSDYDDYLTWPAANDANKMPRTGGPEAIVDYGNDRSILFGQNGLTEVTGGADDEISFAQLQNISVAMPAHVITKCGDCIIFMAPGPKLMKFQYGRVSRIDWPVNKDFRSWPSMTSLRCWHDASRNYFCVTNLSSYKTHIYSLDEDKWLGFWTYGAAQDESIVGGCSMTGANDQPYALEYVYVNDMLMRFDSTKTKDAIDATSGNDESFRCAIQARPTNLENQSTKKRLRSVYADVRGEWTITLQYRNNVDDSWTSVTWGTITGAGTIDPPARYEFREFTLRATANSGGATTPIFRSLTPNIQIVSRDKL